MQKKKICNSPTKLKISGMPTTTIDFFLKSLIFFLGGLGVSLNSCLQKNSCYFNSNGPILLFWVRQGKFEQATCQFKNISFFWSLGNLGVERKNTHPVYWDTMSNIKCTVLYFCGHNERHKIRQLNSI